MGMRYRRSNRANHGGGFSPKVQMTALLLGPWTWIFVLAAAGVVGLSAALIAYALLIVSIWVPWDRLWNRALAYAAKRR